MKSFAIAAAFFTVALAQSGTPAHAACSAVTVTVTSTMQHVPSAPGVVLPTGPAPFPTGAASVPAVGTGYSGVPKPSGSAGVPVVSGTGAYSAPPAQFTGGASSFKIGGVAAAGAVAAFFL